MQWTAPTQRHRNVPKYGVVGRAANVSSLAGLGPGQGGGQMRALSVELVQLEQAGFEALFEGGEGGGGHGWNQPEMRVDFPYLCPYRLKGPGQIFEQVVEK